MKIVFKLGTQFGVRTNILPWWAYRVRQPRDFCCKCKPANQRSALSVPSVRAQFHQSVMASRSSGTFTLRSVWRTPYVYGLQISNLFYVKCRMKRSKFKALTMTFNHLILMNVRLLNRVTKIVIPK